MKEVKIYESKKGKGNLGDSHFTSNGSQNTSGLRCSPKSRKTLFKNVKIADSSTTIQEPQESVSEQSAFHINYKNDLDKYKNPVEFVDDYSDSESQDENTSDDTQLRT